ncbi:MAG: hypothetical protein AAF567_18940 [Actinomycetota bacterium]
MNSKFLTAITCVIALTLAACGGGSDSTTGGTTSGATGNSGGAETAGEILFSGDFSSVCNGVGVSSATGYQVGTPVTHMLAFVGEGNDYSERTTFLNDAWRTPIGELGGVQLAVCLQRTAEVAGAICPGFESDGIEWEVQTFGATYEVSVRDARTAAVVETATFNLPPDDCPIFSSYQEGDPSPKPDYANPQGDLEALLAPIASGTAGAATQPATDDTTSTDTTSTDTGADTTGTTDDDSSGTTGGTAAPSRDQAVDQLVSLGGYSVAEAECVVDGTIAQYGEFVLEPTAEQEAVLGQLLLDCAAQFGSTDDAGSTSGGTTDLGNGPDTPAPGTDAALDALWNACAGGDAGSCDELYFESPLGSEYERFGFSCGFRTEEIVDCATLLG